MFTPYDVTTKNFQGSNLDSYDFANENLNGCSFNKSRVTDSDFCFSNLTKADLRFKEVNECLFMLADMECCNLRKVDLSTARLDSAILNKADLRGTTLPKVHRRETLVDVRVDRTTTIPLSYFYSLTANEKNNIYWQMFPSHKVNVEKIGLFCLEQDALPPQLVPMIYLNMMGIAHSPIYSFAVLHQIIYQNQNYWKSIAPMTKDAPLSIELMIQVMHAPIGDIAYLNEQWNRIRTIAQAPPHTSSLFSEELHPMIKKLHHAILNNALNSFKLEFDVEVKKIQEECSIIKKTNTRAVSI